MKKIPITIAALLAALIGCGSNNKQSNQPAPAAQAMERTETPATPVTPEQAPAATEPAAEETPPVVAEQTPPAPQPRERAEADIKLLKTGTSIGTMGFVQTGGTTTMTAKFAGLPPGEHGFHIHEKGDCGGKNAKNAGGHLNPTAVKHGPPESSQRHAGDLGNLVVDQDGNATFDMATDSLTVTLGADSVLDRAIVIHAKKDNGKTQPSGGSGDPIACGVIRMVDGQTVSVIVK